MKLSVVIITFNEEANLPRTLASVKGIADEIIVVDSGSTDRTRAIAEAAGAKVFVEEWKGFAAQKNSALDKASGEWVLSLDADEEVSEELKAFAALYAANGAFPLGRGKELLSRTTGLGVEVKQGCTGYFLPRRNMFLGRWIRHGGFYPDRKLRLFKRDAGRFEDRAVHETAHVIGPTANARSGSGEPALIHHAYPTLSSYIEHMNRYSSLGAQMTGPRGFSFINIVLRPLATFVYNYFFRLGFLDGREGLLLHLYHAAYVSWKYAKAWEMSRQPSAGSHQDKP